MNKIQNALRQNFTQKELLKLSQFFHDLNVDVNVSLYDFWIDLDLVAGRGVLDKSCSCVGGQGCYDCCPPNY